MFSCGIYEIFKQPCSQSNFLKIVFCIPLIDKRCAGDETRLIFKNTFYRAPGDISLHKKWSFASRISSVNVIKSAVFCGFGHIYWRNHWWKISFFVRCILWKRSKKSQNKDFFNKCKQIGTKQRIWPHLLKKFLMEIFFFCAVKILSSVHDKFLQI